MKQQESAAFYFTNDSEGRYVETEGTFADGQKVKLKRDRVANAIVTIAVSGHASIQAGPGSTVTITYQEPKSE